MFIKISDQHAQDIPFQELSYRAIDFYRAKPVRNRRIHIMGIGNVGSFVAHAIRGLPDPPPVTLIFSSRDKLNQWQESKQRLTIVTEGDSEICDGFDAEFARPRIRFHGKEVVVDDSSEDSSIQSHTQGPQVFEGESTDPISSLIICTKAPFILQGLSAVKHRLRKSSVVLFMINGMGTVEEVNRELFPDPTTRPYYMVGIITHGMHKTPGDPFTTVHAGFGTMSLGIMPHERERGLDEQLAPNQEFDAKKTEPRSSIQSDEDISSNQSDPPKYALWTPNARYLLRTLLRAPVLSAVGLSPTDLLQTQLEKLAVNCVVNPLTVMMDARNGLILYNYHFTRVLRLLLAEICLVIRSMPELEYIPNVADRFDPGRLESRVISIAQATKDNISSMLADARAGRETEIDYINGWVVKKGEELGISCWCNYVMVQMVKGKGMAIQLETAEGVPSIGQRKRESRLEIREVIVSERKLQAERIKGQGEDNEVEEKNSESGRSRDGIEES